MTGSWIEEISLCFRPLKLSRDYLSTLMYLTKNVIIHVRQSYEGKDS